MPPIFMPSIAIPNMSGTLAAANKANEQVASAFDPLRKLLADAQARNEDNFKNTTKQNTLDWEAKLMGATDINQLDQEFGRELAQKQLGAAYDPTVLNAAREKQREQLRTDNAREYVQQVRNPENGELPKTNAEIADLLKNKKNNEMDVDLANRMLTGGLDGRIADAKYLREEQARTQEKQILAGLADITRYQQSPGGDFRSGLEAAIEQLPEGVDVTKFIERAHAADNANYRLSAKALESLDDHDKATSVQRDKLTADSQYARTAAASKYEKLLSNTISPSAQAKKDQNILMALDIGEGNFPGDGNGETLATKMNALIKQGHDKGMVNMIAWDAWESTTKGKKDGILSEPKLVQEVMNTFSDLSKKLPMLEAAAQGVKEAELQGTSQLTEFNQQRMGEYQQIRDSWRAGKGGALPTGTQRILQNNSAQGQATQSNIQALQKAAAEEKAAEEKAAEEKAAEEAQEQILQNAVHPTPENKRHLQLLDTTGMREVVEFPVRMIDAASQKILWDPVRRVAKDFKAQRN